MRALVVKSFILSFLISYSSAYLLTDFQTQFLWKVNLALIPVLGNPFLIVDAVPPPEEVAKLKEKIKKGKVLLEELNETLEKIKENLKETKEVEKETLDKIVEIKDNFQKLQVDPSDLSKDLIEDFKIKVVEAFKLIMESYGLDKASLKKKAAEIKKEEQQTTEEVLAEDTTTTTVEPVVDNKVEKPFPEEL